MDTRDRRNEGIRAVKTRPKGNLVATGGGRDAAQNQDKVLSLHGIQFLPNFTISSGGKLEVEGGMDEDFLHSRRCHWSG